MDEFREVVSLVPWEIIFTLVNFLILFFIMKKFLFKPVKKMLDDRKKDIHDSYKQAQEAMDQAEEMKAQYRQKLSGAKEEAGEILFQARQRSQELEEKMVRQAKEKAAAQQRAAEEEIRRQKDKAVAEMKEDISSMAVSIAAKVIEKDLSQTGDEEFLASCIDQLDKQQDEK